jgi:hypothetical protein
VWGNRITELADLYYRRHQDGISFWMVMLETTIVLPFIIDVLPLLI